ncbi:MAG: hypothetical protein ABI352_06260 [Candidatus Dormibacter sp.]
MFSDSTPHPAFEPALIGQVIEWSVWPHLVAPSDGDLRLFLPTRDIGIDGAHAAPTMSLST